ncbi:MAG: hypothetical protein EBZ69_01255 [Alphaproteobacteria bacterium]|jgi:hypothetical protein|nr:hypothetical protein [Alphaproteobacteria bacterium]
MTTVEDIFLILIQNIRNINYEMFLQINYTMNTLNNILSVNENMLFKYLDVIKENYIILKYFEIYNFYNNRYLQYFNDYINDNIIRNNITIEQENFKINLNNFNKINNSFETIINQLLKKYIFNNYVHINKNNTTTIKKELLNYYLDNCVNIKKTKRHIEENYDKKTKKIKI